MRISADVRNPILNDSIKNILTSLSNSHKGPSSFRDRSKYILLCSENMTYSDVAEQTGVSRRTVSLWVKRFKEKLPLLNDLAQRSIKDLKKAIYEILSDNYRSGAPAKYSDEIRKAVILMCCQDVKDYVSSASRWTLSLLQFSLINEKIVENISIGSIYYILKSVDLKPWKNRYYLHSKEKFEDYDTFKEKVKRINFDYILSNIHRRVIESSGSTLVNDKCALIMKGGNDDSSASSDFYSPCDVQNKLLKSSKNCRNSNSPESSNKRNCKKENFKFHNWLESAINAAFARLVQAEDSGGRGTWIEAEDWLESAINAAFARLVQAEDSGGRGAWIEAEDWLESAINAAFSAIAHPEENKSQVSTKLSESCVENKSRLTFSDNLILNKNFQNNREILISKFNFTGKQLDDLLIDEVRMREFNEISEHLLFENSYNEDTCTAATEDENELVYRCYTSWDNFICKNYPNYYNDKQSWFRIFSMDENSGIQALEKRYPDLPAKPATKDSKGKPHREEFSYDRHGTTGLIAYKDILSGKIRVVYINKTRTELDLGISFYHLLLLNKDNIKIITTLDNLNTHSSEVLVRLVSHFCGYTEDLGEKGKYGILKNSDTRMKFLSDPSHRVSFHYTPVHCSWLNQIEIEFSIFARRFYKGNSFTSVKDLEEQIGNYFKIHNKYFAKPFKWSYHSVPKKPEPKE